jgi:hypothetical protein
MRRLSTVLACVLFGATAHAQTTDADAKRAFEEGMALEAKHDFSSALEKFKESEKSKKTLSNRFHQAYCTEMLGKLAAALNEYEVIDVEARRGNRADIVQAVAARMAALQGRIPQLALKAPPPLPKGAEVTLDGSFLSTAMLDGRSFHVDPGEHVIVVKAPEYEPFTKRFSVAEGGTASVEIDLQRSTPAPVAVHEEEPVTEPPKEPPPARSSTLPILTTAGAGVLLAGGIVSYLVADGNHEDAETRCLTQRTCDDEQRSIRTFDALALGGFIGAAGLAALSVVLWTHKPNTTRAALRGSWAFVEGRF